MALADRPHRGFCKALVGTIRPQQTALCLAQPRGISAQLFKAIRLPRDP